LSADKFLRQSKEGGRIKTTTLVLSNLNFMSVISINVQEPYHSLILNGKKTVEGRLNKGKFASIKVGDFLELEPEKIKFKIVGKNVYSNFKEMIKKEGIKNVIPDKKNIHEAVSVYYKFYTKDQETIFGVIAVRMRKSAASE